MSVVSIRVINCKSIIIGDVTFLPYRRPQIKFMPFFFLKVSYYYSSRNYFGQLQGSWRGPFLLTQHNVMAV